MPSTTKFLLTGKNHFSLEIVRADLKIRFCQFIYKKKEKNDQFNSNYREDKIFPSDFLGNMAFLGRFRLV